MSTQRLSRRLQRLLVQNPERAEAKIRATLLQVNFPQDVVFFRKLLAEVLRNQGRFDEAEAEENQT